ncbi:MAG: ferredoxin--NADP reductase [Ilumatobacteraceae bacterium]
MSESSNERETVRRHAYHALRVLRIVEETPDTRTFVMDVPESISEFYRYEPGQFCTVRAHLDGNDVQRCYSMSSAPATDDRLAVTVKRVPGGLMSNHLHDHVVAGDELELMPPAGVFCERPGDGPIVAFAGGSGVTPVFSIVKQALHSGRRAVRLFYANRDLESVIFDAALADLEARHPERLTVRRHLDSDAGYVQAGDVAAFLTDSITADPSDADVYICGPTPFMDLVEAGALAAGIPADHIAIERFANAAVLGDAVATAAPSAPSATDASAATALTITIKRKKYRLDHVAGDTVLDAARRATLNPPYSCEQGNCATCMALVTEGTVAMRVNNALTPDEVAEGWILTCQALPTSPTLTVVYDDL